MRTSSSVGWSSSAGYQYHQMTTFRAVSKASAWSRSSCHDPNGWRSAVNGQGRPSCGSSHNGTPAVTG